MDLLGRNMIEAIMLLFIEPRTPDMGEILQRFRDVAPVEACLVDAGSGEFPAEIVTGARTLRVMEERAVKARVCSSCVTVFLPAKNVVEPRSRDPTGAYSGQGLCLV